VSEVIEFDPVDALATGAKGDPGERTFLIQARKNDAQLTVVVEKEQVALLASEATTFLDRLSDDYPEGDAATAEQPGEPDPDVDDEPLFRARMIGIGFDPARDLVLLELREESPAGDDAESSAPQPEPTSLEASEGFVARLFATRMQVRSLIAAGAAAVAGGRPTCLLCDQPMDPAGHICPRWN